MCVYIRVYIKRQQNNCTLNSLKLLFPLLLLLLQRLKCYYIAKVYGSTNDDVHLLPEKSKTGGIEECEFKSQL